MYSQNSEEFAILAAVGTKVGKFLDIGAFDSKWCSNTLALVERGWSGVMVEPALHPFRELLNNQGDNPKIVLVQAAVGTERGVVKFWNAPSGVATTDPAHFQKWNKELPYDHPYFIPQISLAELLNKWPGPYDVVSIDTEGTSVSLFWELMKLTYSSPPQVIVVEHNNAEQACISVVGARYEVVERNGENLVFVRRDRGNSARD